MKKLKSFKYYQTSVRNLGKDASERVSRALESSKIRYERAAKHRLHIGVAGLSGAGKSTFLTSLIAHLEQHDKRLLGGFNAALERRIDSIEFKSNEISPSRFED